MVFIGIVVTVMSGISGVIFSILFIGIEYLLVLKSLNRNNCPFM